MHVVAGFSPRSGQERTRAKARDYVLNPTAAHAGWRPRLFQPCHDNHSSMIGAHWEGGSSLVWT